MRNVPLVLTAALAACGTLASQIPLPTYTNAFTASATRGYFFEAPTSFVVTALQVPDEGNLGAQVVALYIMASRPPEFSQSMQATPAFFAAASNTDPIPVVPPVLIQPGDWVGVLGAAGPPTGSVRNSYGAGNYASRVLGQPMTLHRFLMQANIGTNQGVGNVSAEGTFSIARVRMFVAGQGQALPYGSSSGPGTLVVSDPFPPSIGFNGELRILPGAGSNQGAALLLSRRLSPGIPVPPFGELLVTVPVLANLIVPGPIPGAGSAVTLPIPNDTNLLGAQVAFQAALIDAPAATLTNGMEWTLGR